MHPLGKTRPEIQLGHTRQFHNPTCTNRAFHATNQPFQGKHKLTSSHPKVRDTHLNRWFTLPTKITLLITPRCVPHILTGNVQSIKLQCLRQNVNSADRCQHANSTHIQTVNPCTTLHMTEEQITVVSARKTHRHVMQQKWKPVQNSWQLTSKMLKLGLTSPNSVRSSPVQSEIVHNSEISKLSMSVPKETSQTSQNCYSTPISAWQLFHHSFCISPRSCRRLPSLALPPGLETLKTYTLGGNLPTQTILWASAANLYNKLPFSSNSRAFIMPCQRYSLGLYFRRIPASAFWR